MSDKKLCGVLSFHFLPFIFYMFNLNSINKSWTLFLDRDGVINREIKDDYVRNAEQFIFYHGVLEAMQILNERFGVIVLVTNQRGIGRGLMTVDDLNNITAKMNTEIIAGGGRIDSVFYCTDVDSASQNRKPNIGMAKQAQEKYQQINFSESIMVGNKLSDMQFGRNAGMATVFIASTNPEVVYPHTLIDARFDSLLTFAKAL